MEVIFKIYGDVLSGKPSKNPHVREPSEETLYS